MSVTRRQFLAASAFILGPLSACGKKGNWPEGMAEIKWDRDTCVRCSMVISDPRFAAEMRGGEKNTVFKFDDICCLVFWLRDKAAQFPWMAAAGTRMWVADAADITPPGSTPRGYLGGRLSPMDYNFAAARDASPAD